MAAVDLKVNKEKLIKLDIYIQKCQDKLKSEQNPHMKDWLNREIRKHTKAKEILA
jgi:hypothetical protein